MPFETRIVRQMLPASTVYQNQIPVTGTNMLDLIPPDPSGDWRYREMQMMPAYESTSSYTVPGGSGGNTSGYTVPGSYTVPPSEVLVVWERYKENCQ